jgi:antitoxin YefM
VPQSLSMSEAREQLTRLPERLAEAPETDAITITRHGEPVLAVLPYDFYESIMETLEIMSDPDELSAVRAGLQDLVEGRTISLAEAKRRLGV